MKEAFTYDEEGYFTGTTEIQASPLENNVYLLPSNTTLTKPSVVNKGMIQQMVEGAWRTVKSYKDTPLWEGSIEVIWPFHSKWPDNFSTTAPEITEEEKNAFRREEIILALNQIDLLSVRPLRAISSGTSTEEDITKLATLDKEARELREELQLIK